MLICAAFRRRATALTAAISCVLFVSLPFAATAGTIFPGLYRLLDHPDGALNPPPYGLRVDDIGYTFSAETGGAFLTLDWDDGAGTATISGSLWNNQLGELWSVDYVMTGLTDAGANLGFTASAGSGTLFDAGNNPFHVLTGELQGGSGPVFEFLADGHRLTGDNDSPVGRGWLLPPGSTDDWLVRAVVIPEPTTGALLALGLAGLGLRGRRSR